MIEPRMSIETKNIPRALKEIPHWINWRYETREGKVTKVPIIPITGEPASVTNPDTWYSFEYAVSSFYTGRNSDGIGFVLTGGIVGVDLDHSIEDGKILPWAQEILDVLNSYCEITPSGCGLRIYVRGVLPPGGRHKKNIEMYETGRFFTVTGWLPQTEKKYPSEIQDRQRRIEALHLQVFGSPSEVLPKPVGVPKDEDGDDDLIMKAMSSENAQKFCELWEGNISDYPSSSEADLALATLLAFWTGKDPVKMDRLFRKSKLMRPKWDEKHGEGTYGAMTIRKAQEGSIEIYVPGREEINVTYRVDAFIKFSTGAFSIEECARMVDGPRGTVQRVLHRRLQSGVLKKSGFHNGVYEKVETRKQILDPFSVEPTPHPIDLSCLYLGDVSIIYPKSLIVIAGGSNAGKTAYLLNVVRDNMMKNRVIYFSSELGPEMLNIRLKNFEGGPEQFKQAIKNGSLEFQVWNGSGVLEPDCINIIDFLTPKAGQEFFTMGRDLESIQQKLDKGLALVAIQKPPGRDMGYGGDLTLHYSQIYLGLYNYREIKNELPPGVSYNKAVATKIKSWKHPESNPNGTHLYYSLQGGCNFTVRQSWTKERLSE